MRFDIFTLFPEVFNSYLETGIIGRAMDNGLLQVGLHNIRDWAWDKHHVTDDAPYAGGGGMVMKPEPVFSAVEDVLGKPASCPVILLTPQGRSFSQQIAQELAENSHIGLLCGRYEGIDERIRQYLVSDEISIGDYVLTGGELPALVLLDAVTRLLPGALGDPNGARDDSHASGLLEYPHYTRPADFRAWKVPEVLLSGDHARIARWRRNQALLRTLQRRPDLLSDAELSEEDLRFLEELDDGQQKFKR
ncbi:MAG: tRNA (guanosine(37)-N1)-methyltransferase TrmD [Anaerolineaceae bacterium]|nr:tRNA (guanosine(37)-N1)-methyltransferase TrmD [Anaerolineaceae bacterium]